MRAAVAGQNILCLIIHARTSNKERMEGPCWKRGQWIPQWRRRWLKLRDVALTYFVIPEHSANPPRVSAAPKKTLVSVCLSVCLSLSVCMSVCHCLSVCHSLLPSSICSVIVWLSVSVSVTAVLLLRRSFIIAPSNH